MCGIAGVRRFGNEPITGEEIVLLLCSLEHRGTHATGVALMNPDGIHVYKAALPAWRFTKTKEFETFLESFLTEQTEAALLHTRFATTGDPSDNNNNHPMFDGETAVVHNGMISNHTWLFNQNKEYKRSCETDSDIIRAVLDHHGFNEKGIRELGKMTGSAAIACVSTKHPHTLLLARSGSPLVYGFDNDGDKLYWASEEHALMRAARPFHLVRGVWVQGAKAEILIGSMPDNTAWLFGPERMELHHHFPVCAYYRQPDYTKGRETYHAKTKSWKKELRRQMAQREAQKEPARRVYPILPAPKAATTIPAKNDDLKGAVIACPACGHAMKNTNGVAWDKLQCQDCNASLG